jgi:signal transduction histidine kinase
MIEELDRANAIITEFLSLAKNKMVEIKAVNINTILKNIYPLMLASAMMQDKMISLDLEGIPDLLLDEQEIRQLILNLINNGLESIQEGKAVFVSTYTTEGKVVLAVRDQGTGIKKENFDKLGTPFFSTKEGGPAWAWPYVMGSHPVTMPK